MIVDTQPYCTLEYLPEFHCLLQTWEGFARSQQFRDSIQKSLEFFQAHSHDVRSIISDTRKQEAVSKENAEWVGAEITPKLVQHGLQKMAFIAPEHIVTKWAEERFAQTAGERPQIRWFPTIDEAKTWISEMA